MERPPLLHGHQAPSRHAEQNQAFVDLIVERLLFPHGHQAPSRYAEQNPISWSPASENPSDSEIRKQTGEDLEFRVEEWPLVSVARVQKGRNVMRQTRCLVRDSVNLVWWEPDTPSSFLKSHGLPTKPETHVPAGQGAQGQAGHRLPVGNVRI